MNSEGHALPSFCVIDQNPDDRLLAVTSLRRRFRDSIIVDTESYRELSREIDLAEFSLIVAHRTAEMETVALTQELKQRFASVPVLMMSSYDRSERAREAGANFVLTDHWAEIGRIAAEMLADHHHASGGDCDGDRPGGPNAAPVPPAHSR